VRGRQTERGQAMLIVAAAIIGLIAFIGLMVDSGILFIANGHLRRAVDAAALSAATQLREGADPDDLAKAAKEFMALNGVDPDTVTVETCDYTAPPPSHSG
jgi:Flp pilus assembly protein TadG